MRRCSLQSSALVVALAAIALVVPACGDEGSEEPKESTVSEAELSAADDDAKTQARTAQTTLETYAVENNGSYAGASAEALSGLEPAIADAEGLTVTAQAGGYTVSVESPSTGNTFELSRSQNGAVSYSCTDAGNAGCPGTGDWSQ